MASVAQRLRLKVAQTAWSTEASASVYDANATRAYRHVGR
ncbi:CBS domain containing protein (plasmid) [Burkholderia sp. YI23]|nr:CBS domain containing protein [Burkholderia sp. YI23]AET94846.1 CBS domain containing protein [Burkholderia sp. YI23]